MVFLSGALTGMWNADCVFSGVWAGMWNVDCVFFWSLGWNVDCGFFLGSRLECGLWFFLGSCLSCGAKTPEKKNTIHNQHSSQDSKQKNTIHIPGPPAKIRPQNQEPARIRAPSIKSGTVDKYRMTVPGIG
jgi:hypothetical protein